MPPFLFLEIESDCRNRNLALIEVKFFFMAALFLFAGWALAGCSPGSPGEGETPEKKYLRLLKEYKCDCSKEDWTRTLYGCFEPCADRQRKLLKGFVDANHSNEEIRKKLIADAGTELVLARPSFLPNLIPYGLLAFLGIGVVFTLTRMRTRTESDPGKDGALLPSENPELEARLEAELDRLKD